MTITDVIKTFRERVEGIGGNELVVRRIVYDDMINMRGLSLVLGYYGTGKTVAGRYLVNETRGREWTVHILLREVSRSGKTPRVCGSSDFWSTILYYIENPVLPIGYAVYANYEPGVFKLEGTTPEECFKSLIEQVKKTGRRLNVVIDEFDRLDEVYRDDFHERRDMAQVFQRFAPIVRGSDGYLRVYLLAPSEFVGPVLDRLASLGFSFDHVRGGILNIPPNMNSVEYQMYLNRICTYFNFDCDKHQILTIADFVSRIDARLWSITSRIMREVESTLQSLDCRDLDCIRQKHAKLDLKALASEVEVLRFLNAQYWLRELHRRSTDVIPITSSDVQRTVEVLYTDILQHLKKKNFEIRTTEDKNLVGNLSIRIAKLRYANKTYTLILYARLQGSDIDFSNDAIFNKIKKYLDIEQCPSAQSKRRGIRLQIPVAIVLKHKNISDRATEATFTSCGIPYYSLNLHPHIIKYLIDKARGMADNKGEGALHVEVLEPIENFLRGLLSVQ
jgi:hypothetical protein